MVLDVGHLAEGVCETPLVHDDFDVGGESKGAVLGACRWHDQAVIENLFVGVMDVILTAGWGVDTFRSLEFLLMHSLTLCFSLSLKPAEGSELGYCSSFNAFSNLQVTPPD